MGKRQYDILELSKMPREELMKVAKEAKVDTLNKIRQTIMYEILELQSSQTVES